MIRRREPLGRLLLVVALASPLGLVVCRIPWGGTGSTPVLKPALPADPRCQAADEGETTVRISRSPQASFPVPITVRTPAELREVLEFTRGAEHAQCSVLRALALSAPDPLVSGNAIRALGRLGEFALEPELHRLLDDPRPRVRHESIRAVGLSGDSSLVRLLLPALESVDSLDRTLACHALERLGHPTTSEAPTDPQATLPPTASMQARAPRHPGCNDESP